MLRGASNVSAHELRHFITIDLASKILSYVGELSQSAICDVTGYAIVNLFMCHLYLSLA